jgi:hypothetical protein
MERTRLRKPSRSQDKGACPVEPALLAPAAKSTPPEREHPIPKHAQTLEVAGDRIVVEVILTQFCFCEFRSREFFNSVGPGRWPGQNLERNSIP